MSCDYVQRTISDSLAAGVELPREVRAHADSCPACRAALEREQALFAALKTALHARANAGVPADFLPRVRVRIADAPVPLRLFFPAWVAAFSLAAVALALAIGFVLRPHRSGTSNGAGITPPVVRTVPPAVSVPGTTLPPGRITPSARSTPRIRRGVNSVKPQAPALAAEVLVSREDRLALALLVRKLEQAGSPQSRALAAPLVPEAELALPADLKIPHLEVKPLESDDGER